MDVRTPELRITEGMGLIEMQNLAAKLRAEATREMFAAAAKWISELRLPQVLRTAH